MCKPITIYRYTNLINSKVYIGSSDDVMRRQKQHQIVAKTSNYYFYKSIRKYGWDKFKFEVIEENVCPLIRNERENFWIKHHNSIDPHHGYNSCLADCTEQTEASRLKRSASNKGKSPSEEARKKMSDAKKGKKRKPFTDETKRKIAEAKMGNKNPQYGKPRSKDAIAKSIATRKSHKLR